MLLETHHLLDPLFRHNRIFDRFTRPADMKWRVTSVVIPHTPLLPCRPQADPHTIELVHPRYCEVCCGTTTVSLVFNYAKCRAVSSHNPLHVPDNTQSKGKPSRLLMTSGVAMGVRSTVVTGTSHESKHLQMPSDFFCLSTTKKLSQF